MNRPTLAVALAVACISPTPTAAHQGFHLLSSEWLAQDQTAIILGPSGIPQPSDVYLQTVYDNYLLPNGFGGPDTLTVIGQNDSIEQPVTGLVSLWTPEAMMNTAGSLQLDEAVILNAIAAQAPTADAPLTLFGYSQSAAAISVVMQELRDHGGIMTAPDGQLIDVDPQAIHVVLVGDSASPDGMLANIYQSLPSWAQPIVAANEDAWGLSGVLADPSHTGAVTPDDYFQTVAYSLPGDGFANWSPTDFWQDLAVQLAGVFSWHETYLGLGPVEGIDPGVFSSGDELALVSLQPPDDLWQALVWAAADVGWITPGVAEALEGWL